MVLGTMNLDNANGLHVYYASELRLLGLTEEKMSQTQTIEKIGTWASIACLIHCTILPIVVPFLPIVSFFIEQEWVEVIFWIISFVSGVWQIWQYPGKLRLWFVVWLIVGTIALFIDQHHVLHVAFLGIASGSLEALRRNRKEWREWKEKQKTQKE